MLAIGSLGATRSAVAASPPSGRYPTSPVERTRHGAPFTESGGVTSNCLAWRARIAPTICAASGPAKEARRHSSSARTFMPAWPSQRAPCRDLIPGVLRRRRAHEEELLEVRLNLAPPDVLEPLGQIVLHEVRDAELAVRVVDVLVDRREQPDRDDHRLRPPRRGEAAEHVEVGLQAQEREPPPKRVVEARDRAVRRVHRPDDVEVRRRAQLAAARQRHRALAVLEQVHQLTEHPRQVRRG